MSDLKAKTANNENSTVKKHISICQDKDYRGIEIKTIVQENDPALSAPIRSTLHKKSTNLSSSSERNTANSRTFCFNDYLSTYGETLCSVTLDHFIVLFVLYFIPICI